MRGIIRVTIWGIGLLTCLVSPPDPPSASSRSQADCNSDRGYVLHAARGDECQTGDLLI